MAVLSFRSVLLFFMQLVIISEIVCFPAHLLSNNLFSNGLHYVTKHLNLIQPQFSLQKLLVPVYNQNVMYTRPNAGRYNVLQNVPATESYTETIKDLKSSFNSENINSNNGTQNTTIDNKDVDQKWNLFFDEYFKNESSKSDSSLITQNNINREESQDPLQNIFDDNNKENTETTDNLTTDITDTTLIDNETTTDDDLLRNGVPPELLSSLLG